MKPKLPTFSIKGAGLNIQSMMKNKLKVQDRVAIYESIGLTQEQALKVDELLLTELAKQKKEIIEKLEKQLSGYDDGKRTNKERQLIYRLNKLIKTIKEMK